MNKKNDVQLFEIGKLVVELSMIGGTDSNLDALLERMITVLEKLPQLRLQHRGAIYMYSPRNSPVRVAQLLRPTLNQGNFPALLQVGREVLSQAAM